MDTIKDTIVCVVTNKWVVVFSIVLFALYLIGNIRDEEFKMINPLGQIVDIPTGIYTLQNSFGTIHSESIFGIPQLDTSNVTQPDSSSSFAKKWAIKQVIPGIYLIRKPRANLQGAECLYTGNDNMVRGYIVSDPKVCGMETLNEKNELDPYSIRLYFKIIQAEEGRVVIQSLQNNHYLSYDGKKLSLRLSPDDTSYFEIL